MEREDNIEQEGQPSNAGMGKASPQDEKKIEEPTVIQPAQLQKK